MQIRSRDEFPVTHSGHLAVYVGEAVSFCHYLHLAWGHPWASVHLLEDLNPASSELDYVSYGHEQHHRLERVHLVMSQTNKVFDLALDSSAPFNLS